jgi:hypothetical protein
MVQAGVELIIAHGGVPHPGQDDPAEAIVARLRRRFTISEPPVIGAGALLSTLAD